MGRLHRLQGSLKALGYSMPMARSSKALNPKPWEKPDELQEGVLPYL